MRHRTAIPRHLLNAGRCAVVLLLVLSETVQTVQAQPVPCDEAIARAEADYFAGRFDEAIDPLNRCLLEDAFSPAQQQEAYTLLGRIYFAKGLEVEAREALRKLIQMVPSYEPDPNFPPSFKALVTEIKQEIAAEQETTEPIVEEQEVQEPEQETPPPPVITEEPPPRQRSNLRRWLLIGGGAVLAGTVALLLGGGGGNGGGNGGGGIDTGFPPPPTRPSGQ